MAIENRSEMDEQLPRKNRKKFAMPDAYIIMLFIMLLAALATYFLPSGAFDRVEQGDITVVVPDSFHTVAGDPTGILDFFLFIQNGMVETAGIIFLVLIIGGTFAVIESTGAINASIMKAVNKTKNREHLLVIFVGVLLAVGGLTGAISNAVIAFIPIGIILAKALDLDAIAGVAIIKLTAYVGFNTSFMSPFTVLIAQDIAGLPLYSGIIFRCIMTVVVFAGTLAYILWYIKRVKNDPSKSLMGENRFPKGDEKVSKDVQLEFTGKHKLILLFVGLMIVFYIVGALQFSWSLNHMAAIFLIISVGTGIIAKMSPNFVVKEFMGGARNLVYGALIIGLARAIVLVLQNGMILDTIVHWLAVAMEPFSSVFGAIAMFIGNSLFALLVSSGSGNAVVMMPILTPLADIMEVPRQVAVTAYQLSDGFMNSITPASGVLLACLAIGGVPWTKWVKFMIPLIVLWYVLSMIFLAIGVIIGWGPNY
ncbi:YfcC family protein [Virgibacillus phasianinus]|nr:YfcC family protein [Virgibacillus phasianinus]